MVAAPRPQQARAEAAAAADVVGRNMSKLSFRARALDVTKPMPIYMSEELPDLPDYSAINRAVPQMPSGMEKDEECEHHLQRAICAGLIIPTPEVSEIPDKEVHDRLYPANYKQPRQLIHMQPFAMEQDIPDYDMDEEDEQWVESRGRRLDQLSPLKFEEMMDRLEKSSGQTVVTLAEAKALLKEDDDLIVAVFDYWLNKRLKLQHPLILNVKTGQAANNPYLAFRRRTEKMQTRKNRKNDETSYEKMLKLRRDLARAVTLLELVKRREKMKREMVHLTVEVFEKRHAARDFAGAVVDQAHRACAARPAFTPIFHNHYTNQSWANKTTIKDEAIPRKEASRRQYKKRKHKSMHVPASRFGAGVLEPAGGVSSDEEPVAPASPVPSESDDEGMFAFRRNKLCTYHTPLSHEGNWPWCSKEENGLADKRYRYTLASTAHPRRCLGFARRRLGRGGRVILDRLGRGVDDFWQSMDYTVFERRSDSGSAVVRSEQPATDRTSGAPVLGDERGGDGVGAVRDGIKQELDDGAVQEGRVQPQLLHAAGSSSDMIGLLQSVRDEWLHFRPKTPPIDWSPPCHLLPADEPFIPSANQPFAMELQSLDAGGTDCGDVFVDSAYMRSLFTLDYDFYPEVPVTDTRQPTTSSAVFASDSHNTLISANVNSLTVVKEERTDDDDDDDEGSSGGTVGSSRFSVTDAVRGKVAAAPSSKSSSQCRAAGTSAAASAKVNSVYVLPEEARSRLVATCEPSHSSNTNGLIVGSSLFNVGNRIRTNKMQPYPYNRAVGTLSGVNNTLSLHTAAHTVTLNSHSERRRGDGSADGGGGVSVGSCGSGVAGHHQNQVADAQEQPGDGGDVMLNVKLAACARREMALYQRPPPPGRSRSGNGGNVAAAKPSPPQSALATTCQVGNVLRKRT